MSATSKTKVGIKPEVMAAISAALTLYGYTAQNGYQISKVTRGFNPWRKAGITEIMLGRDMDKSLM